MDAEMGFHNNHALMTVPTISAIWCANAFESLITNANEMGEQDTGSGQQPRIRDIGFSILHDPPQAIADIIFIHGLQGHPRRTWTCDRGSEASPHVSKETSEASKRGIKKLLRTFRTSSKDVAETDEIFWPLDLLPDDCSTARILTWGYDSKVSHFFAGPANQDNIAAHARNLLRALRNIRLELEERKIIFVAHSLGGIIVKDVLRRAADDIDPAFQNIFASTEAILFLGTPHRGSNKAGIGEVVRKIVSVSGFDTTDQNIRALQVNGGELEMIHELFMKLYERKDRSFKVFTFQEAKGIIGISYLKLNERVVEPFTSRITTEPNQTINGNHMSMCRFQSRNDEGYRQILGEITVLISGIDKTLRKGKEVDNLNPGSPSQTTTASVAYSLNDVERKCIALLTQNTSNAAEYRSSLPRHVEGTCQWILSNPQYIDWNLQKETCLLWISGYPGSGKTILSSYLLEYLDAAEFSPSLRSTLCYFFCDEKIDSQRDGIAILRVLIHQLLMRRRSLIKYVKHAYDVQGPQFDQNFNELWRIFLAIASDRRVGPIRVIIDAIDECEEITRERFLHDVTNLINKAHSRGSKAPCIKFLVTSRPILGRQYTANMLLIDPSQDHVENDLKIFIEKRVQGIVQRTCCKPDVQAYLEQALYSKADRTFLWVTLVLHLLEKSYLASQKDFKRIIDELPKTLTATYECFLHGISSEYQLLAARLLHLLVGSSRPLTLEEMRVLIAIQDEHHTLAAIEEDAQPNIGEVIQGVLGPLVRIWDSRIYLVHQSLKEFLQILSTQKENPLSALYGVDPCNASLLLAKACVSYLLLNDFAEDLFAEGSSIFEYSPTSPVVSSTEIEYVEKFWDTLNLEDDILFHDPAVLEADAAKSIAGKYTLFDYAARYWPEHFSAVCSISPPTLQESVLLLSDLCSSEGLNWFRFYWLYAESDLECPRDFSPIVTASYFGHSTSLKLLLENAPLGFELGSRSLYWASRMGHTDVVEILLQQKSDPNAKVLNGQNALTAAVHFNRLPVVKCLLLEEGFISNSMGYRVNYAGTGGRTPLSIAASNGLIEVARELLKHPRIQPNITDDDAWTPLFWSISGKQLDMLQLLIIDDRISVNHLDTAGRNVLSWAAAEGESDIVKYLTSLKHLRADEADQTGRTPFSWAAGNGHLESIVALRRSQRIDVSRRDRDGRNAISWACSGGHDKVIKYLIKYDEQGADREDVDGWTPLAWALFNNTPKTVQVLLESGDIDVNKKDTNGRSALSFAAGYGYLEVVKLLLKTPGIEVDSKDNDGRAPLSYAERHPDIMEALQGSIK